MRLERVEARLAVASGEENLRLLRLLQLEDRAGEALLALETRHARGLAHLHAGVVELGEIGGFHHPALVAGLEDHHVGGLQAVALRHLLRLGEVLVGIDHPHLDPRGSGSVALEQLLGRRIELLRGPHEDHRLDVLVERREHVEAFLGERIELAAGPVPALVILPAEVVDQHQERGHHHDAGSQRRGLHDLLFRRRGHRYLHLLAARARVERKRKKPLAVR